MHNEIQNWEVFLEDGKRFLKTATNGAGKPEKFTPDILFNITTMAIEKYIMAYLVKEKSLPFNHTMVDLLEGLKVVTTVDADLEKRMMYLNDFQEICSLEHYDRKIPKNDDIPYIISTGAMVADFVDSKL